MTQDYRESKISDFKKLVTQKYKIDRNENEVIGFSGIHKALLIEKFRNKIRGEYTNEYQCS